MKVIQNAAIETMLLAHRHGKFDIDNAETYRFTDTDLLYIALKAPGATCKGPDGQFLTDDELAIAQGAVDNWVQCYHMEKLQREKPFRVCVN